MYVLHEELIIRNELLVKRKKLQAKLISIRRDLSDKVIILGSEAQTNIGTIDEGNCLRRKLKRNKKAGQRVTLGQKFTWYLNFLFFSYIYNF